MSLFGNKLWFPALTCVNNSLSLSFLQNFKYADKRAVNLLLGRIIENSALLILCQLNYAGFLALKTMTRTKTYSGEFEQIELLTIAKGE